jgi:quercetin dioxygenase-like cupin family protein
MSSVRVVRRSFSRAGKLVPAGAKRFRGRSVKLSPGQAIAWHSTGVREEMLIALAGRLQLERDDGAGSLKMTTLVAGQCAWIPSGTQHRVVNRARRKAQYLYLTA